MRVAVLSDIHGNLRGLDACLDDLTAQGGADVVVAAGDLCMDGPRGVEVIERLTSIGAQAIRGNTDREIASADLATFDEDEAAAVRWQREHLGLARVHWLRDLPPRLRFGRAGNELLVVHANPQDDETHIWPDADDALLDRLLAGIDARAIAFGHLHLPYVRVWRGILLANVASAGLPKDGDSRAGYAIFTERSGGWEVKHRRVDFDVDKFAKEIERSGMPDAKQRLKVLRRARYKAIGAVIP